MLSLIIASRNRSKSLAACLKAINSQQMRDIGAQLIVVNNASTDATPEILEEFCADVDFSVVVVNEPIPGKACALNAGLAAAEGDVLAFIDDDCYLAVDYLSTIDCLFDGEDYGYCGGRVLLYDQQDAAYVLVEDNDKAIIPPGSFISAGRLLGANMVFKREVIETVGEFDTMFGPGTRFRCDDIDYIARASLAGFVGAYVPELVVYHHHRRKPGREIWVLKRANDIARGAYYMKFILEGHSLFIKSWLFETLRHPNVIGLGMEIYGASTYLVARALSFWAKISR